MPNEREKQMEHQREQQLRELHARSLFSESQQNDPATLKYVTEYDDLPDLPTEALGFLNSKVVSTANLTEEQVESVEWFKELTLLRYRAAHPPRYGLTGLARAFALNDASEYRKPLSETDKIKMEGTGWISELAATRSEDFKGVETTTSDTKESIINETGGDGGGIRGRLGGQ